MPVHEERDPLFDLLKGAALPPSEPGRREAIFAQTREVLRRRRLWRRSGRIAVWAACYCGGVLSVLAWQSAARQAPPAGRAQDMNESRPSSLAATLDAMPQQQPASPGPSRSVSRFEKMRRAGDRQLNEYANLQGAIGCYRRALEFASDEELQIVPERDSWLLMTLKQARLETRQHVHKKG